MSRTVVSLDANMISVPPGFIGSCVQMQAVYRMIQAVASIKATVFITGESGTGKEVCAQAIRTVGNRQAKPFIAINCSAMPRDLVESEVFGHVKGAFTGAVSSRAGAAIQAQGGTLFLDEICEMDIGLQAKLLRFLETGVVHRVGSSTAEKVDVRIVCATNRDPEAEVASGRFREDLYYRLHVIPVHLPPLRERGTDVLQIARAQLATLAAEEQRSIKDLAPCAEAAIMTYSWPGNVRQLRNVLRSTVLLSSEDQLTADALPEPIRSAAEVTQFARSPQLTLVSGARPKPVLDGNVSINVAPAPAGTIEPLWQVERRTILDAIRLCNDNILRAATLLEISPSTIYRKRQAWSSIADHEPYLLEQTAG